MSQNPAQSPSFSNFLAITQGILFIIGMFHLDEHLQVRVLHIFSCCNYIYNCNL